MAQLTHDTYLKLEAQGRRPIQLPAEIYFSGNVDRQKTPGIHHLPQYRKTGTYHLPALKEQRKREAMDRAKRLLNGKMSEVEMQQIGGLNGIKEALKEHGLTINKEQWTIAETNANFLEMEIAGKQKAREQERMELEAKLGKKIEMIEADTEPSVGATVVSERKMSADEDLSSLTSEEEKEEKSESTPSQELELETL